MAGTICSTASGYFEQMGQVLKRIDGSAIDRFGDLLFEAWRDDRQVFVFGNGGSASTASHQVCDFVKTACVDGKRRLRAFSMVDNLGMLTAVGNDISYDDTLLFPLVSYAKAGDLAVGLSCSGNSPNLLKACSWAKEKGLTVVAMTGFAGGKVKDLAHLHINIPSENYGIIEDLHLSIGHIAAQRLKSRVSSQSAEGACRS